jgi:hypothetical protein
MKRQLVLASVGVLVLLVSAAKAMGAGPVNGQAALESARAAALKWQSDAELFDFGTLSTAPLDAEGRSAEWYVKWSSKSAGQVNLMSVKNGAVGTFAHAGAGGRVIKLSPKSMLDTKQLLAMADAKGGAAARARGATVSAGLVENRGVGGPLWHFSYAAKDGKEVLHVSIEADTGKVKVLSN